MEQPSLLTFVVLISVVIHNTHTCKLLTVLVFLVVYFRKFRIDYNTLGCLKK